MIKKSCKQCEKDFVVTDDDLEFYKKISPTFDGKTFEIPAPTLCPDCRRQKRIAWRNIGKFYRRKSDLSGKDIVSCFAPNSKFTIWQFDEWMSDEMDPYEFGRDIDFSRPFFDQLFELEKDVPLPHMNVINNENSEFVNNTGDSKNSYLVENSTGAEDSYYSLGLFYCKDCVDCFKAYHSENCYECINVEKCYGCLFCKDLINCSESIMLESCTGCKNCFGCSNLSNKQYWIFNEAKTKEGFEKIRNQFLNGSIDVRSKLVLEAQKHNQKLPKKFAHEYSNENSTGDYISHNKNVIHSFFSSFCEDCSRCTNINYCKDFADVDYWGDFAELAYNSAEVGTKSHQIMFSRKCHGDVRNIFYCTDCCLGSHDLFGCCGIKHGEYSILNKKYSPEEYDRTVAKIIEHMQKNDEWGEFFPYKMSQFAYNETSAMDYFPLTKEETLKLGSYWQDQSCDQKYNDEGYRPLEIGQYVVQKKADELLKSVLVCAKSSRPYKIQPQELSFYLRNNIQIPLLHPDERYKNRFSQINPQQTWHRKCMNDGCQNEFDTTYSPDRPEKVYCETCHQKCIV